MSPKLGLTTLICMVLSTGCEERAKVTTQTNDNIANLWLDAGFIPASKIDKVSYHSPIHERYIIVVSEQYLDSAVTSLAEHSSVKLSPEALSELLPSSGTTELTGDVVAFMIRGVSINNGVGRYSVYRQDDDSLMVLFTGLGESAPIPETRPLIVLFPRGEAPNNIKDVYVKFARMR